MIRFWGIIGWFGVCYAQRTEQETQTSFGGLLGIKAAQLYIERIMAKRLYLVFCVLGFLAVLLGAFGAHGLKNLLDAKQMSQWDKAVLYQFVHVVVGLHATKGGNANTRWTGFALLAGILCFSGSLYLLATRHLTGLSGQWIGPITPLGGVFFLLGWVLLGLQTYNKDHTKPKDHN